MINSGIRDSIFRGNTAGLLSQGPADTTERALKGTIGLNVFLFKPFFFCLTFFAVLQAAWQKATTLRAVLRMRKAQM